MIVFHLIELLQHVWIHFLDLLNWFKVNDINKNNLQILHLSENFIIVNKSYDVVINSNDPSVKVSLQLQLKKLFPGLVNPNLQHDFYFVHRLDFATSGVICIALHKHAATVAASAFHSRTTKKYYLAIVRGHVANELIEIRDAIGEDVREKHGNHRMCTASDPNCSLPRFAHTRLLVLQRGFFASYPASKVLIRPITGRRHQIRVHCSSVGHTIVGDYTYSNRKDITPARTYLHSFRLIVPNDIEAIDVQTKDPFPNENNPYTWMVVENINVLNQTAFAKLDLTTEVVS